MKSRVLWAVGIILLVLLIPTVVFAQGSVTEDMNYAQVRATFGSWTNLDAQINGYVRDPFCITSGSAEVGDMGFHAGKGSLIDDAILASEPEVLLMDGSGNVVGVEYLVVDVGQGTPSLFGQPFEGPMPGHTPDMPVHYDLHVWLIPNPSGIFADFNPNVTCPAGSTPPTPPETGDLSLPWAYIALAGGFALILGFGLLRRVARKT